MRHNRNDPLCQCRKCCWPQRPNGKVARIAERMHIVDLFSTGGPSADTQTMQAHAAALSHRGVQGGSGDKFKGLKSEDLFPALDKYAMQRMEKGLHPRPCWKIGLCRILGIGGNDALLRWLARQGKTPDDVETYLNEKFKSR